MEIKMHNPYRKLEDNIKINLKETGCESVEVTELAEDKA
jgi:hypothetical protein